MCEYCGCQAIPAIDLLTREHDMVVNLIGDVRAAHGDADLPGMAGLARQIAMVLGPHTEVEEHGLFPPLTGEFADQVALLQAEHRRVEAVLAEAEARVPVDPTWPDRLLDVHDLLREHILKEQNGVFPAALVNLDTADWQAIDAVRSRVGTYLRTALPPQGNAT
jgi:hypothetical protein